MILHVITSDEGLRTINQAIQLAIKVQQGFELKGMQEEIQQLNHEKLLLIEAQIEMLMRVNNIKP
jgi:hypothetical protein